MSDVVAGNPEPEGATTRRVVRSSAIVAAGTTLSRVTGFLRISAIAAIGFDRLTDVYNIANSTPAILYELLLGGVLTAALVPLFVDQLRRDDERGTSAVVNVALAALAAITVVGILAAPWLVRVYTLRIDAVDRAAQQALATDLLRFLMPQVFFLGVIALATALLNARRRFAAAAFAPVLNNVVVITTFLALPRVADEPLTVQSVLDDPALVALMGLGTTAGMAAVAIVLAPAVRAAGAHIRLGRVWRDPAVHLLARLSGWTVGYVVANQVAFWVVLVLAYGRAGDASVYLAAFVFFQLPHGLFAVSIMTTIAPELADAASRGDEQALRDRFSIGLRLMALVILPASVVLTLLAAPIVTGLLRYGDFSAESADLTSETLAAFGLGLAFFSVYLFTLRGFYALQDTRTPFLLNCFENGLNIALALALYPSLGVQGLALAWSIAYAIASIGALAALRRRLGRLDGRRLVGSFARSGAAALTLGGVAWAVAQAIGFDDGPRALVATLAALVVGGVTWWILLIVLRVDELTLLRAAWARSPRPEETALE